MSFSREPRIHPIAIDTLRPTQITVGMREVKAKRKSWRGRQETKGEDFLGTHMVIPPFLTGFARRIYAANFSFCAGVMPPMPMLGRSLL